MLLYLCFAWNVEYRSVWKVLLYCVLSVVATVGDGDAGGSRNFKCAAVFWNDARVLDALWVSVGGDLFLLLYFEN